MLSPRLRPVLALCLLAASLNPCAAAADEDQLVRAMVIAIARDDSDQVDQLLKQGVDPNVRRDGRRSLLCEAVGQREVVILKRLLAAGAKPDDSALWQAGWLNKTEALRLLLAAGGDPNPALSGASLGGHVELVKLLLEKGANANFEPGEKSRPLHGAAAQGGLETVELLLKAGADPNAKDSRGITPLQRALQGGHDLATVQALVKAGAKLDIPDEQGLTPARYARIFRRHEIHQWLLKQSDGKEPRPPSDLNSAASKKPTPELLQDIQQLEDAKLGFEAYRELLARGKEVMPDVLKSMKEDARWDSFQPLLIALGPDAQAALPHLRELLADREHIFSALTTVEYIDSEYFEKLPPSEQQATAETIYQISLSQNLPEEAGHTISVLTRLGEVAAPQLLKLLQSENRERVRVTADCLQAAYFTNEEILQELLKQAREVEDPRLKQELIKASSVFGRGKDKRVKALLLEIITTPPPDRIDRSQIYPVDTWRPIAETAARALSRFGPEAMEDLIPLLSPVDRPERLPAMAGLERFGPASLPRLIELLGHENQDIAMSASVILSRISFYRINKDAQPKSEVVPLLIKALASDDDRQARNTAEALRLRGQNPSSVPALLKQATNEQRTDATRLAALRAVLTIDPKTKSAEETLAAIPLLIRVLDEGPFRQRGEAAEVLGKIGPAAKDALLHLRANLELPPEGTDTDGVVRDYVQRNARDAIKAIEQEESK